MSLLNQPQTDMEPFPLCHQLMRAICTYYTNIDYIRSLIDKAVAAGEDLSAPLANADGHETSLLDIALEGCVYARRWNVDDAPPP